MLCPTCNLDTKVADSRLKDGQQWRRRACDKCGNRFNTLEIRTDDLYAFKNKITIDEAMAVIAEALTNFKKERENEIST